MGASSSLRQLYDLVAVLEPRRDENDGRQGKRAQTIQAHIANRQRKQAAKASRAKTVTHLGCVWTVRTRASLNAFRWPIILRDACLNVKHEVPCVTRGAAPMPGRIDGLMSTFVPIREARAMQCAFAHRSECQRRVINLMSNKPFDDASPYNYLVSWRLGFNPDFPDLAIAQIAFGRGLKEVRRAIAGKEDAPALEVVTTERQLREMAKDFAQAARKLAKAAKEAKARQRLN
jgi:hypothetical protein